MPDYSKGKIYKVINTQNEIIYIGSTIQQLSHRFCRHIHKGGGNKIVLLENCPCNSKEELFKKEQEYIEQHNNLLNKQRAYNSEEYNDKYTKKRKKEYYNNNKDRIKERKKIYYNKNKEELNKKVKCDLCNAEISKQNLTRHKKNQKCLENRIICD
jgi:hypothetical protein